MKRIVDILLTGMAMLAVALLSAFAAMRIAIHGREVEVPVLTGLTVVEASHEAARLGLSLQLEKPLLLHHHLLRPSPRPVPPPPEPPCAASGPSASPRASVPSRSPSRRRRPDRAPRLTRPPQGLAGGRRRRLPRRPRRPRFVLAQTPPPNAEGVDRPSVSLLLSAPASSAPEAFVAPSFTGLSFGTAQSRAAAMGLRAYAVVETPTPAPETPASPAYHDSFFVGQTAAPTPVTPPAVTSSAIVVGQSPQAGHRVTRNEAIRLTLAH